MTSIPARIRSLRKAAHLTQDELALRIGANRVTVASYESGRYRPSVDALERLSSALGVTPNDITGHTLPSGDDLQDLHDRLRADPNYRLLLQAAGRATSDHLRAAAMMLLSLESPE